MKKKEVRIEYTPPEPHFIVLKGRRKLCPTPWKAHFINLKCFKRATYPNTDITLMLF